MPSNKSLKAMTKTEDTSCVSIYLAGRWTFA